MWCPPEDPDGKKNTVLHQIEGIEKFVIWFKAVIQFPTLNKEKKLYVNAVPSYTSSFHSRNARFIIVVILWMVRDQPMDTMPGH